MRLGQVLAVGALALVEVGHGVEAEAVQPEVQPEAQDVEHRLLDLGVVVVEVGLVGEEAVPEVGAGDWSSQVQLEVSVSVKMIRASSYLWTVSDHTYQSRSGESRRLARAWNHGWSQDVWFMTRSAMTRMPRWWAASMKSRTSSTVP